MLILAMSASDRACACFARAREALATRRDEDAFVGYLTASHEFEAAVNTLHRAMAAGEYLRRRCGARLHRPNWPGEADRDAIRTFRNAIEHADEALADGRIEEGTAPVVVITSVGQAIEIGKRRLETGFVAKAIEKVDISLAEGVEAWLHQRADEPGGPGEPNAQQTTPARVVSASGRESSSSSDSRA